MSLRFFKRIRLLPGVSLNLSKSGASLSFGPRGAKVTVGPRGIRKTVGLPGTGISYTTQRSWGGKKAAPQKPPTVDPAAALEPGFFERLTMSDSEQALLAGLQELLRADEAAAFARFSESDRPDAAFLAGFLALAAGDAEQAESFLLRALRQEQELGSNFARYGLSLELELAVTGTITAAIERPSAKAAKLALVEAYQARQKFSEAIDLLLELQEREPEEPVIRLSLAELLFELALDSDTETELLEEVVRLGSGVKNDSAAAAGVLYYQARALRELGLTEQAVEQFSALLRKTADRPEELLKAIRYERALAWDELGKSADCRKDLERLYAEDPDYLDVRKRLRELRTTLGTDTP